MLNQKFWEKYFKVYDALNEMIPYQELLIELEKELDLNQEDFVLDIGSGTGNLMTVLKGKCKKIIGIDFSEAGIALHKIKDPTAELILCDITNEIPFANNYFSKIVSNNVIYTLDSNNQEKAFLEIYRILKPGGRFVVSNVKKGFSPIKICGDHLLKSIKRDGILKTLASFSVLLPAMIKIFFYNIQIKNSGQERKYNFFKAGEQKALLQKVGFSNVSEERLVYSDQAVINSCYKS